MCVGPTLPSTVNQECGDTDAGIMLRVAAGEIDLFELIVQRNQTRVGGFIEYLLPGSPDKEDLVQRVFINLYRSRHRYRQTAHFQTFRFTITRNLVLNERRRLARRPTMSLDAMLGEDGTAEWLAERTCDSEPDVTAIRRERCKHVRIAITKLGARQQKAIHLAVFRGYRYDEAGRQLDVSAKGFKSLLHRAKRNLRRHLAAC